MKDIPEGREYADDSVYSNFDHDLDNSVAVEVDAGKVAQHAAMTPVDGSGARAIHTTTRSCGITRM